MPARRRGAPSLAWSTVRVTAVVLAVLVLLHFAVTHLFTDVAATDSLFVATRWQSGLVAAADWLMLLTAVLHGTAGAWGIANDYVRSPRARTTLAAVLAVLGAAMLTVGTVTLLVVLGR